MLKPIRPPKSASSGFTLIEIMITVLIVAVLAAIATAGYTNQVQKSRRTDARNALLDLAGREEKLFTTVNAYSQIPSDLGYGAAGITFPVNVGSYYTISATVPNPPVSYVITATAIGTQANDTQCATLSVDQTGAQTSTGGATSSTCWGN